MNITDLGNGYGEVKAITSIPGWSEVLNESLRIMGKTDGVELYKQSVWANRCVNVKASALAGIKWGFFGIEDDKLEDEKEKPNLARVLLEASEEENLFDILRGTCSDLDIFGKSFWEKQGEGKTIVGINRVNAGTMKPIIKKGTGEIVGFKQEANGVKKTFDREEIVYFHEYNPSNDLIGISRLEVGRYAIMTEIKANEYLAAFFANGAIPAALLTTEQTMNDVDFDRVQRWWNRKFRGNRNQHKVAFADKGLKLNQLGYNNAELALKEVREEARRDICAVLGVPPALAGAWEAANYAASREQRLSFYTEEIIPRAEYMAGVINAELIAQIDPKLKLAWKYTELDIMQPDMVAERNSIANLVAQGVITPLAGARELGYDDADAGIGPIVTRVIDDTANVTENTPQDQNKTQLQIDLETWERKSLNRLKKQKGAQVDFESDFVPGIVRDAIYNKLAGAATKDDVRAIFGGFE